MAICAVTLFGLKVELTKLTSASRTAAFSAVHCAEGKLLVVKNAKVTVC